MNYTMASRTASSALPGVFAPVLFAALALTVPVHADPAPGPTLAREDTMHTSVPEVVVRAPRVTLDEILDRIARGERRRDSLLVDESFVATFRVMHAKDDRAPVTLLDERVVQVYKKKPDHVRSFTLRHTRGDLDAGRKPRADVDVDFRSDMSEEIVNRAFRPEMRRQYRYRIVGRDILGDHVVYRIRFEPKSLLDPTLPSGLVWVDTNDFVILRQELEYDRSPVPLFVRDVDRVVIERRRVGDFWVLGKVLMRADLTIPMPRLGKRIEMALLFDQYALNRGLPDSVFTTVRP